MQREILFRGKHISGKHWLIGSLVKFSDTEYRIVPEGKNIEDSPFHRSLVIPESVGQFTGLTDKNGNRIFEGDILKSGIRYNYEVYYKDGGFRYATVDRSAIDFAFSGHNWLENILARFEIIGNIHEHPDLLNTK